MNTTLNSRVALSWPDSPPVSRRFGDAEPLRRLYFLDFPLLLLSVGLLTWILPTDTMLFISALTGGAVGLYTLWEIVVRREPLRFSHIFCVANTVGYGLGVVNSWLSTSRGSLGLAEFFNRDTVAVSQAMAAILIASGILYCLGEIYEPPLFARNFRLTLDNRAAAFIAFGTALLLVGFATGKLGYMGSTAADNNGHLGFFGELLSWISPTCFAFSVLCFLEWPKGMVKRFLGVMLALQFILIIPTGRRSLVYFVLLGLIATRFGSFKARWSFAKKIVYVSIVAGLIGVSATAFFYLRYASWGKHHVSLAQRISLAVELYESGDTGKANQSLRENLVKRTFVLGYVSDLLDASFRIKPAEGKNALHEFQLVIPSALWADKSTFLYSEESVANMTYHFAYRDEANSLYSAGAIDFGIWGMILYPIIVTALFRIMAEIVKMNLPDVVAVLVILFFVYAALITEAGLWMRLLTIRDSAVYAGFLWAFFSIPAIRLKRHPQRGALSQ